MLPLKVRSTSLRQRLAIGLSASLAPISLVTTAIAQTPPLPPENAGPRGELCVLTPNVAGTAPIWAASPTFVWQGIAGHITVNANDDHLTALWDYTPTPTETAIPYQGTVPLERGETYVWTASNRFNAPVFIANFALVDEATASQIRADLTTLTAALPPTATADDIALTQATYFAEQGLWTDAIATLRSVTDPDSASAAYLTDITTRICG